MTNKNMLLMGTASLLSLHAAAQNDPKPNIVLIMVDDMGYSDLGCYGGEIPTPNLDNLAKKEYALPISATQDAPAASRASLLTGLYPQQAGIGMMSEDPHSAEDHGVHGYMGYLNRNSVTIAEVLKEAVITPICRENGMSVCTDRKNGRCNVALIIFMVSCQELAVICNLMEIAI